MLKGRYQNRVTYYVGAGVSPRETVVIPIDTFLSDVERDRSHKNARAYGHIPPASVQERPKYFVLSNMHLHRDHHSEIEEDSQLLIDNND